MTINFFLGALLFIVAGCASNTGVVPIGRGTYTIAKQQATGFPGLGNLRAEIIAEASAYCLNNAAQFELLAVQETQPPYILGNYPRSEIKFTCAQGGSKPQTTPGSNNKDPGWKEIS